MLSPTLPALSPYSANNENYLKISCQNGQPRRQINNKKRYKSKFNDEIRSQVGILIEEIKERTNNPNQSNEFNCSEASSGKYAYLWNDELGMEFDEPSTSRSRSIQGHNSRETHDEIDSAVVTQDIKDNLDALNVGDELQVLVSEVNNPLKFWVNIKSPHHERQMKNLKRDMTEFFESNLHSDEVNPFMPELEYFAVKLDDQWERIEILDGNASKVKVAFLDVGTRDTVNMYDIRRLPEQFWTVSRAAVCCELANVSPVGNTFTDASADDFIGIVKDEGLTAKVYKVDKTKSKITVDLMVNSTKKSVKDELVRQGHAVCMGGTEGTML